MADGLNAHASFLKGRHPRSGLPELISKHHDGRLHVLVTSRSADSSWCEVFGDGQQPLDPLVVPLALDVLAAVGDALGELHQRRQAHRALDGMSVLITAGGRCGALRDVGLAWWPRLPGQGGCYRAPEEQSISRVRPGPATDVFQLAALLQHTCTGFQPAAGRPIPLRTFLPAFPERLDTLLAQALDPDVSGRPDMRTLTAGLRRGRRQLFTEATA